jgi:hypothetical protein
VLAFQLPVVSPERGFQNLAKLIESLCRIKTNQRMEQASQHKIVSHIRGIAGDVLRDALSMRGARA